MRVVLDTNVLVSALRSRRGASNEILQCAVRGEYEIVVSTALVLEYADVLHRPGLIPHYSQSEIDEVIDSLCSLAREALIYFRWRPFLRDPKDDLVVECALAGGATKIVSHNVRDFQGVEKVGLSVVTPAEFRIILGL